MYAENPANGKWVTLPMVEDGDLIGPYSIANIERALELKTGFPTA